MEYLDIYDGNGAPLGIKKTKKEAHAEGLWHKAVHIWIINSKGEVLLQKRSPLVDNHPDKWDVSAAGHISAGEDERTSALREVGEEIGLDLSSADLIHIGTVTQQSSRPGYINNEINPVYVVKMDLDTNEMQRQEEEVSEVRFVPYKEFDRMVQQKDQSLVHHPEEFEILFKYLREKS